MEAAHRPTAGVPPRTPRVRGARAVAALSAVLLTVAACSDRTAKAGGEVEPRVLSLVLAEGREVVYAAAVERFVETVHARSDGALVVEVDWGHDLRGAPEGEESLITAVREGRADLSHVPARTFDRVGIDHFRVLQDPLTLDTMAKADAVASSAVADRLLAQLQPAGLVGLGLYAESLRRPVGYRRSLAHADHFDDLSLRAQPSRTSYEILGALGARPSMSSTYSRDPDGAPYDGAESTWHSWAGRHPFPQGARITGDLVLFPKFNVFVAGPATFDALTPTDQQVLRLAAEDAAAWWAEEHRPSEEALAEAWCTGGRRLVMAGPDGLASVRAELRPVTEALEADAEVADALRAVREVAAEHPGAFEAPGWCLPQGGDGGWLDD